MLLIVISIEINQFALEKNDIEDPHRYEKPCIM